MFPDIDWSQPWYASVRAVGAAVSSVAPVADWRTALNLAAAQQQLRNHHGLPLSFVPQQMLPPGTAYESFISASGGVPTRDNLHDFFNALVWLAFPRIKAQLNALQAAAIERAGDKMRGPLRDAATLFDENAALVVVRDSVQGEALAQALRQHRWHDAFVKQHAAFQTDCRIVLFGHALLEKLVAPYKAITAHAWLLMANDEFFDMSAAQQNEWIDTTIARQLRNDLAASDFTPLPVMGIPGWSVQQDETFYADTMVFRPKKRMRAR